MPKPPHELHLDFETYCELDLKKVGIHRYVEHASFRVLCVAWKLDEHAVVSVVGPELPHDLVDALQNREVQGHAFNAAFETAVLTRLGIFPVIPLSCTMQRALAYGLPGKLEAACAAAGVAAQKDMSGHRLMLKMSRPSKPGVVINRAINDYEALAAYCARDVEAEAALSAVIPELSSEEWELSQLDAAMNSSGELGIDVSRVTALGVAAAAAELADAQRCTELTGGAVTSPGTQTARLLAWLASKGLVLDDVSRAVVEEALNNTLWLFQTDVKEVLQIRLRAARAWSVASWCRSRSRAGRSRTGACCPA
jgi:DNA polymerase